jgi:hypothetical protein
MSSVLHIECKDLFDVEPDFDEDEDEDEDERDFDLAFAIIFLPAGGKSTNVGKSSNRNIASLVFVNKSGIIFIKFTVFRCNTEIIPGNDVL